MEPSVAQADPTAENTQAGIPRAYGHARGDVPSHRYRKWSLRGSGLRRFPALVACISIFAVAIMLVTSLPVQSYNAAGSSGLHLASSSSSQGGLTNYPYLVNTSLFPSPDVFPVNDSYTLPQAWSSSSYGLPTVNVLGVRITPTGNETLAIRSGSYSTAIAAQIAEDNSSVNLPIQWGGWTYPYQIETGSTRQCYGEHCLTETTYGTGYTSGITGTAVGGPLVAATIGQNTSVWDGSTQVAGSPVPGWNPHLAEGTNYAVLTTQTSAGIEVTTFYQVSDLYGYVLYHQTTIDVTATDSAVVWLPNEAGGEEGVVVSTPGGAIEFYDSVDGGYTFQGPYSIASYSLLASNRTVLDSIGSTQLTNPYGWPGQVAATVVGDTAMVVYTTAIGGVTAAATAVSVNPTATKWVSGYTTPPSLGSVAYPALIATPMGYVYATWIQDNLQTWSVQLAAFNAAGQPIQAPSALPGTVSSTSPLTVSPPAISIDLFSRPFVIWAVDPGNGALTTMRYTGAYLSASNSLKLLETQLNELQPGDFLAQSSGSLVTGLATDISSDLSLVGKITNSKSTFTYLCQAANLTANTIYTNVSHIEFSLATDLCGNFGYVEKETTPPEIGGVVTGPPPNAAWNPSIATASGPMAAQNYLTTIADWALMALGVSVGWMGNPIAMVTLSQRKQKFNQQERSWTRNPIAIVILSAAKNLVPWVEILRCAQNLIFVQISAKRSRG